jgi:aspartate racemase
MSTTRRNFLKVSIGMVPVAALSNINLNSMPQKIPAMKTLGMIGGTSWHSTADYYRYINQMVNDKLGDKVNPPLVLVNLNQAEIHQMQKEDRWNEIAAIYIDASKKLKRAGAEAIIFCANTPHKNYDLVQQQIDIPILHIADSIGSDAQKLGMKKLILLGTKFTMTEPFIRERLKSKFGIETIVPENYSCEKLQDIISTELSMGVVNNNSKEFIINEISAMKSFEAKGVILGCTELAMIVKQTDVTLPLLNSTYLHAGMAVDFILHKK